MCRFFQAVYAWLQFECSYSKETGWKVQTELTILPKCIQMRLLKTPLALTGTDYVFLCYIQFNVYIGQVIRGYSRV